MFSFGSWAEISLVSIDETISAVFPLRKGLTKGELGRKLGVEETLLGVTARIWGKPEAYCLIAAGYGQPKTMLLHTFPLWTLDLPRGIEVCTKFLVV